MGTEPALSEIAARLRRELPSSDYDVVLFGSRASGRARPRSDWDFGIVGPAPLPLHLVSALREILDEWPTLHTLEIVDLAAASSRFRETALSHAKGLR